MRPAPPTESGAPRRFFTGRIAFLFYGMLLGMLLGVLLGGALHALKG
jgi:hypothetical protein